MVLQNFILCLWVYVSIWVDRNRFGAFLVTSFLRAKSWLFQKLATFHTNSTAHWFQNSSIIQFKYICTNVFFFMKSNTESQSPAILSNIEITFSAEGFTMHLHEPQNTPSHGMWESHVLSIHSPLPHSARVIRYYNPYISIGNRNLEWSFYTPELGNTSEMPKSKTVSLSSLCIQWGAS